jgi:2-polyprenyl-6-hydroxyphenyl methylase/3-demethylubiquinone-9 3-methyltransferase
VHSDSQYVYGTGYTSEKADTTYSYLWPPVDSYLSTLPAGARVLDAGCGNGHFAKHLFDRQYNVCGVDLDESGIQHARKLCPGACFETASLYDDVNELFGSPFDAVVSLEVIEHLYDPRRFVKRVFEALRPGGLFVLSTPYHGYLKNVLICLAGKFDSHVGPLWDGGHIKFWSRRTLSVLLSELRFEVVSFKGAGRLPYLWKAMILAARRPLA